MLNEIVTRPAGEDDIDEMERLFLASFTDAANAEEGLMVSRLARDLWETSPKGDVLGWGAWHDQRIVGAVLMSRLNRESNLLAFLLSPMAVATVYQRRGIGQRLIRVALESLQREGAQFVATYGDPAYYARVGFEPLSIDAFAPPFPLSQPQGWLGQSLADPPVTHWPGPATVVPALRDPSLW